MCVFDKFCLFLFEFFFSQIYRYYCAYGSFFRRLPNYVDCNLSLYTEETIQRKSLSVCLHITWIQGKQGKSKFGSMLHVQIFGKFIKVLKCDIFSMQSVTFQRPVHSNSNLSACIHCRNAFSPKTPSTGLVLVIPWAEMRESDLYSRWNRLSTFRLACIAWCPTMKLT